ncbi:MAG: AAA family ATPase [Acidobacteriota bacterium]
MLTQLTIREFKQFEEVEIELGNPVVFIGPNNCGKTTALQALALWDLGLRRWNEKRSGKSAPEKRPGVTINRRDLISVPVPAANLLWRGLHTRNVRTANGRQVTENIRIDVIVEGVSGKGVWKCGLEFDYANPESFYCRPLRLDETRNPARMPIPEACADVNMAFLPPMSGLADREFVKQPGEISFLIGQGRTAEVLRNLCSQISTDPEKKAGWKGVKQRISDLFGVQLEDPRPIPERAEIELTYRDSSGVRLDLSSSGKGLQQTLLLLAYLAGHPKSVLLLDEPDAHLEILRQRQIYQLLAETAREQESQIIVASHSEVILNEAADRDVVIAFLGKPHRIDDRGSELRKSLRNIGFEQYYQAEQRGWVLYVAGSTHLAILRVFSELLDHPARKLLERPFVHYIQNQIHRAREHFHGLREAKPDLVGFVLADRVDVSLEPEEGLDEYMWQRREIENYLCQPATLRRYAEKFEADVGPLFSAPNAQRGRQMQSCIEDLVPPMALRDPRDRWWWDTRAGDDFLVRLFDAFFRKRDEPNLMRRADYHLLARHVAPEEIDPEIGEVLNRIVAVAGRAKPVV